MKLQSKLEQLKIQLKAAREAMELIEDQVSAVQAKLNKAKFKSDRKALRKKLAKDPMFRATYTMLKRIEQDMYVPRLICESPLSKYAILTMPLGW